MNLLILHHQKQIKTKNSSSSESNESGQYMKEGTNLNHELKSQYKQEKEEQNSISKKSIPIKRTKLFEPYLVKSPSKTNKTEKLYRNGYNSKSSSEGYHRGIWTPHEIEYLLQLKGMPDLKSDSDPWATITTLFNLENERRGLEPRSVTALKENIHKLKSREV